VSLRRSGWNPWPLLREAAASAFARNVAILVSGTTLGYGLTALIAPVLSRLYTPADFGLLALFTSIASILAEAASGRYELAVVLPDRDQESANLLALAVLVAAAGCGLLCAGVALGARPLAELLESPALAPYLWWIPPAVLAIALQRALSYWMTRRRAFRTVSTMHVARAIGVAGVQVGVGAAEATAGGLIGGRAVGEALGGLALLAQLPRGDRHLLRTAITGRQMRAVARAYADFPKFSMPQGLLNAISQSVAALLLAAFFSAETVGLYAMAHRLLYLPSRFLGQSIRQVYVQQASERHARGGNLHRLFARTTVGLALLGLAPALLIVLWGPALFGFLLGEAWTLAGAYARWMVVWLFFGFLNPPATMLMQVLRRQRALLWFDLALFVCRSAALLVGGTWGTPLATVAVFSLIGGVFNAGLILALWVYTRRHCAPPEPA